MEENGTTRLEDTVINYVETVDDINCFMNWLGESRNWLAIDTETSGLNPWDGELRLIQFGDANGGWAMRWDRWAGPALEAIKKYEGHFVLQNAKFDIQWIELHSKEKIFDWRRVHDTRVMAHLLQPNKSTALKSLGAQFLSPEARKLQGALHIGMEKNKWGWGDIPLDWPIYYGYAVVDCILTARVAEQFYPRVFDACYDVYELEMATQHICSDMEVRGFRIDVPYCERMAEKLTQYCQDLEEYCLTNWGVRPSENQAVGRKLRELGVAMPDETPTGEVAVGKQYLEPVAHPLADAVLQHRQKSKVLNSYFKNFLEMHVNGVLHCSINTLAAKTGRMSITNPALQTLPRGSVVRDAFLPYQGQKLLSVDYSGIEARLFAHFAEETEFISRFQGDDGFDPHYYAAQQVFNTETPTKEQRQTAKNCTFALLYGAGPEKMGITAGITSEEAELFITMYKNRFRGVQTFMDTTVWAGKQRLQSDGEAWTRTPLGRRQVAEKDKAYTLVNFLIQGTAADVLKQALVNLDNAGFGECMLLPVHDEVLFSLDDSQDEKEIVELMEDRTNYLVPLICEAVGNLDRWGDKSR